MKGLYVHIPFCVSKCGYCDFYSAGFDKEAADLYKKQIIRLLKKTNERFDTVYFGGGTPSLMGAEIAEILQYVETQQNAEITVECNPGDDLSETLKRLASAGVNRISVGLQSADEGELSALTRRHTARDVTRTLDDCRRAEIENISLDVMLGIQNQTAASLKKTLDFCAASGALHISAYMLKREQDTAFGKMEPALFPDEDKTADLYLQAVETLDSGGFSQYEISNFAKKGAESRHNLIYWNCDPYLGLGPAAHSFWNGRRFYYDRNLSEFTQNPQKIDDGPGGGFEEYFMLRLRLTEGFVFEQASLKGYVWDEDLIERAKVPELSEYIITDERGIRLTPRGFLVQNAVIGRLL